MHYIDAANDPNRSRYYATLFDCAADAMLVLDGEGKILDANTAACEFLGYGKEDLLSLAFFALFDQDDVSGIELYFNAIDDNNSLAFNYAHISRQDAKITVNLKLRPFWDNGQKRLIVTIRDITEYVSVINKIKKQNEYMKMLHIISLGLLDRLRLSDVLTTILQSACEVFGGQDGYICSVDEESGILTFDYGMGRFTDYNDTFTIGEGLIGKVVLSGKPLVIENYNKWPERKKTPFYDDATTCIGIPLKYDSRVIAVIGIDFFGSARSFSAEELEVFESFAELAAIALVNANLHNSLAAAQKDLENKNSQLASANEELVASEEELRQQFDELLTNQEEIRSRNIVLNLLNKTVISLMQRRRIEDVLYDIVVSAAELFGSKYAYIYLLNEEENILEVCCSAGGEPELDRCRLQVGEGVVGRVVQTGQPLIVHDYQSWPGRSKNPVWAKVHTCAGIPLKSGDKFIGEINLDYFEPRAFSENEMRMLGHFAEIASIALENVKFFSRLEDSNTELCARNEELTSLYEELRATEEELRQQFQELLLREEEVSRRNILLELLNKTAVALLRRANSEEVFEIILSNAAKLVGTNHGYISFLSENEKFFDRKISLGYYAQDKGLRTGVTEGLDGQVFKHGKVMNVDDYMTWEHHIEDPFFANLRSIASVPLKVEQKVIGILGLGFLESERGFRPEDLYLLERFADLASVVLDNAILLRTYKEEMAERQKAQVALSESEIKYRAIFDGANDGIYIHDINSGKLLDVNIRACEMHGYTREELLGESKNYLGTGEHPYTREQARYLLKLAAEGQPQLFEWKFKTRFGQIISVEVNLKVAKIGSQECILAIVRDISERMQQELTIRRMAYHDALTGLPNRAYLADLVAQELEKARRGEAAGAILFIDMDDLKMINDTFGHSYGDLVLIGVGAYIFDAIDDEMVVARIGGDEFVVLLKGHTEREKVTQIVGNLVKALGREYQMGESHAHMTASVGVALYPADGDSIEELYKNADLALYAAKRRGKNTWCFYDEKLREKAHRDMVLVQGLRGAAGREELLLHYQPIISAGDNMLIGFEALLRWLNPSYGMISPEQFITLAEESGDIKKIGEWVIKEACLFAAKLNKLGAGNLKVSINISPKQLLADDFVPVLRSSVTAAGIPSGQLMMEITESVVINSIEDSIVRLKEIKDFGVGLAIDDFGTGYCSLNYLRRLPAENLKIDKSFIEQITIDNEQYKFVKSMIDMAHVMGLTVVAEGVETNEQLEVLLQCGCDFMQGYLFSRPVAEPDALKMIYFD